MPINPRSPATGSRTPLIRYSRIASFPPLFDELQPQLEGIVEQLTQERQIGRARVWFERQMIGQHARSEHQIFAVGQIDQNDLISKDAHQLVVDRIRTCDEFPQFGLGRIEAHGRAAVVFECGLDQWPHYRISLALTRQHIGRRAAAF